MKKLFVLCIFIALVLGAVTSQQSFQQLNILSADRSASTAITQNGTNLAVSTGVAATGPISGTTGTFSGALSSASGSIAGALAVDTSTLVVDAVNNRVGIGTASPARYLHIDGNTQYPFVYLYGAYTPTGSTSKGVQILFGDAGAAARTLMGQFDYSSYAGGAGTNFFISSSGGINFRVGSSSVNNSTGMSIDSSGNTTMGGTYVTLPGNCKDWGMRSSEPTSPTPAEGDRYYNTTNTIDALFIHNGTAWERVSRGVTTTKVLVATDEIPCTTQNVNISSTSDITLDGSTNDAARQVIDIGGAVDGQILTVINTGTAGFSITIPCFGGGALYSKVIARGGAASIVLGCGPTGRNDGATFRYVAALTRWVQIG